MTYYITTPIYYVNDKPHIGHAYTSIACDVLARFARFFEEEVVFLTGTDEHGQKVDKSAQKMGTPTQEFVDSVAENFKALSGALNLSNDDFIRTTEERHKKAVSALWNKLIENRHIYLGSYSGWYALRDEAFYQESELIDGKAPTGAEVEWVTEPSYFFNLSKWQEPLLEFYKNNPHFIGPESRRNEVIRFVESGLHDLSVSRTSFQWGIPVPNDPSHVIYVWLDALTNYLTAIGYPNMNEKFQSLWDSSIHIVGKDILRFHAVYWPAFLMAAGINPPKRIFAHGWWTNEGQKISKSLGNTIDPIDLVKEYGIDPVRYFLLREVTFGQDGDFSKSALIARLNSDLANAYGNLVQRVLSFVNKNVDGKIPDPTPEIMNQEEHANFLKSFDTLPKTVKKLLDDQAIHKILEVIWDYIHAANRYIDEQKPWTLKKVSPEKMNTVLYILMEAIKIIALFTQPILPEASAKILDLLAVDPKHRTITTMMKACLIPGNSLPEPQPIFPRYGA